MISLACMSEIGKGIVRPNERTRAASTAESTALRAGVGEATTRCSLPTGVYRSLRSVLLSVDDCCYASHLPLTIITGSTRFPCHIPGADATFSHAPIHNNHSGKDSFQERKGTDEVSNVHCLKWMRSASRLQVMHLGINSLASLS